MSFRRIAFLALIALATTGFICNDAPPAVSTTPPASVPELDRSQDPDLLAARTKGQANAPVTVIEMSDFQCPYCRAFATQTFPTLDQEYIQSGKVRWIFVNFPLTELHPNAVAAAELALCSAKQGKFWPMHDLLYTHQPLWAPLREPGQFLLTLADSLRIPRDSIVPCVQNAEFRQLVQKDANTAARIGARSTPSFLIEGALLSGAYPVEVFRKVLDSIYTSKRAATPGR